MRNYYSRYRYEAHGMWREWGEFVLVFDQNYSVFSGHTAANERK